MPLCRNSSMNFLVPTIQNSLPSCANPSPWASLCSASSADSHRRKNSDEGHAQRTSDTARGTCSQADAAGRSRLACFGRSPRTAHRIQVVLREMSGNGVGDMQWGVLFHDDVGLIALVLKTFEIEHVFGGIGAFFPLLVICGGLDKINSGMQREWVAVL